MTCALITVAMQLTCLLDNQIACTDNEYLAQMLDVRSCERMLSNRDFSAFVSDLLRTGSRSIEARPELLLQR